MGEPWKKYAGQELQQSQQASQTGAGPWAKYQGGPKMVQTDFGMYPANQVIEITGGKRASDAKPTKPSLFRMDSDFLKTPGVGIHDMFWASAKDMFGGRQGAAEYLAREAGGTASQDEDGSPVVVLKDGTRYRMNDKGLDSTDVGNVAGNVAAMWLPAGWASRYAQARNVGLLGRMGIQGATAATGEAGLMAGFNGGQIDPMRVGLAGLGGTGGELVGTGLGAMAGSGSSLARGLLGQNRAPARAVITAQGATPTEGLVRNVEQRMPQIAAGADPRAIVGQGQFGFRYSLGQRLTDPRRKFEQLSREEVLRQNSHGHAAFDEMGRHNARQLDDALSGYGQEFGGRAAATPAELVQGSAAGLSRQAADLEGRIGAAYAEAGNGARTAVSADAITAMPERLRASVRDFDVNPSTTPAASRALVQLQEATRGILDAPAGSNVRGVTLRALETQRRILGMGISAASNPTDRAAMTAIKREFDGWLDNAVESSLVSGDRAALESLRNARALRAEYGRRFEGGQESDRFIQGLLNGSRTPEELLNIALGASSVSKAGGSRFVERLRAAANNDPEIMGGLRQAHFMRLTRGNDGRPADVGQIVRNIRQTQYTNESAVRALYTPQQWQQIRLLATSLEPMIARGDFAKSSGSIERLWRGLVSNLMGSKLGGVWGVATSGLKGVQAQRAITAPVRRPASPLPGFTPASGETLSEYGRGR